MSEMNSPEMVNIEEIMQEIRQQILAKKDLVRQDKEPLVVVSGKRLSPQFYEQLYQASLVHDQVGVTLELTQSHVPIIGRWLQKVRLMLHELVLFYVNKQAAEQIQFNTQILKAVSLMAQELEAEEIVKSEQ